jgi:hypothetical protein
MNRRNFFKGLFRMDIKKNKYFMVKFKYGGFNGLKLFKNDEFFEYIKKLDDNYINGCYISYNIKFENKAEYLKCLDIDNISEECFNDLRRIFVNDIYGNWPYMIKDNV